MQVTRLDQLSHSKAYGIFCAGVPTAWGRAGLYPTSCRIPPGAHSVAHAHYESEIFYVVSGQGRMVIGSESALVSAGDLIQIPPFSRHELINSGQAELEFLSLYSEDFLVEPVSPEVTITSAPPTPNGPLHLGHLSGPYLASDIVARYLEQRGSMVLSHSGTDDHQNYVRERARSLGQSPEVFRQQMRSRIVGGMERVGISLDEFIEPKKDPDYQLRVQDFVHRAIESQVVEKVTVDFPYCEHCELSLVDALISGSCPECGEDSRGGCENCGLVFPPMQLRDPHCARCLRPASNRATSVHQFSLSKNISLIQGDLARLNLSPRIRGMIQAVAEKADFKVLLTYPVKGEPECLIHPESGLGIHVWFEMAAHYEAFARSPRQWVHCFGFDNSFYYLLFIPALLKALDPVAKLPDAILANEFLLLDGFKFSTSRNHAIWADEFTGDADHLRLYLAYERPASMQSNFVLAEFEQFSSQLSSRLERLLENCSRLKQNTYDRDSALVACNRVTRDFEYFYSPQSFDLRQASRRLMAWMDSTAQAQGSGQKEFLMLWTLAQLMKPLMPQESKRLYRALEKTRASELPRIWFNDWEKAL